MWFSAAKLTKALADLKDRYPATTYNNIKGGNRYGWAITGNTGKVDDIHGRRYKSFGKERDCSRTTKAYYGHFKEILEQMEALVGTTYRARVIGIDGFREIAMHHDGHDGSKFWRYHIPIVPNPKCIFTADGLEFVMNEAGRLYRFPAWAQHAVVNYDGPRVHLMFSAFRDINEMTPADKSDCSAVF